MATAITSNTTGLSNAVSDYIEALADSIEKPTEVISTEDMLYRVGEHNKEVREMRTEYENKRDEKWRCRCCKVIQIHCTNCQEQRPENSDLKAEMPSVSIPTVTEDLEASMPGIGKRMAAEEYLEEDTIYRKALNVEEMTYKVSNQVTKACQEDPRSAIRNRDLKASMPQPEKCNKNNPPLQPPQEEMTVEQGAGGLQETSENSSPLQPPQRVMTVEQEAGVLPDLEAIMPGG